MDSFELNKIAGAVLFSCLVVLGLSIVAEGVFHAPQPEQPGYEIAVAEDTGGGAGEEEEAGPDLGTLLASADPAAGESAVRPCTTCHTFEEGGAAQVGPNLYGVVGGPKAHMEGFSYSSAMQERAAAGESWGYEELDQFLANPRGYISGTSMAFAGVRDAEDRANILAYLASLTPDAPPFPEPAAEEAGGEEAAAEGEAAGEEVSAEEDAAAAGESDDATAEDAAAEGEAAGDEAEATADEAGDGDAAPAADEGATEDAASEDAASEDAASEDAATEEEATDEGATEEQPAEGQPAEGQPAEGQPAEEQPAEEEDAAAAGGDSALLQRIAAADPAEGPSATRACMACHTFEQGEANRVGPNLYNVVGGPMGHLEDFNYSSAMQERHDAGDTWGYEELDAFLAAPREFLDGTNMAFAGVRDEDDRATIIAYLASLSENAPPLPDGN